MIDQIKDLINNLPHIDLFGEKCIRFDEPVVVTPPTSDRAYYVWAVSFVSRGGGGIQWMDGHELWDYLYERHHPDEAIGEAIIKRLQALQVSVTPIDNNPNYHQFL